MSPDLRSDDHDVRALLARAATREPSLVEPNAALDRIVSSGRRRRRLRNIGTGMGVVCAVALIVGLVWTAVPPLRAPSATVAGATSSVPDSDWPTPAALTAIGYRVAAVGGGTVTHTDTTDTYFGLPVGADATGRDVWPPNSPIRSRLSQLTVNTEDGDYQIDVSVEETHADSRADTDASINPCVQLALRDCELLDRQPNGAVIAYSDDDGSQHKSIGAWIWRADTLAMRVTVRNFHEESPAEKAAGTRYFLGPDWKALGITPQDLWDATS